MPTLKHPTAGSVILAGVLLKMGTYGFPALQSLICSLKHRVRLAPWIAGAGGDWYLVRRYGFLRSERCQEAGRLFFRQPPGIRNAGTCLRSICRALKGAYCR